MGMAAAALLALAGCSGESAGESETVADDKAAGEAAEPAGEPPLQSDEDALVPGTDYNATAEVRCGADGALDAMCKAGVRRRAFEDGTTVVEITRPDGLPRAIFFQETKATGADSAEADGSAGFTFKATREGDETLIEFGPERYSIPDALVVGG